MQPRQDLRNGAPHGGRNVAPPFGTNDRQVDIDPLAPKPIECFEDLQMAFAGFDGPNHEKAWAGRKGGESLRCILGETPGRNGVGDVGPSGNQPMRKGRWRNEPEGSTHARRSSSDRSRNAQCPIRT